jgi:hypothetical protein
VKHVNDLAWSIGTDEGKCIEGIGSDVVNIVGREVCMSENLR